MPRKITLTAEVVERFKAYHRRNPGWGPLHVVMEDGNVEDHSVYFCLGSAKGQEDLEGYALALLLADMTKTQTVQSEVEALRRSGL